jgi:hypothetical protein
MKGIGLACASGPRLYQITLGRITGDRQAAAVPCGPLRHERIRRLTARCGGRGNVSSTDSRGWYGEAPHTDPTIAVIIV